MHLYQDSKNLFLEKSSKVENFFVPSLVKKNAIIHKSIITIEFFIYISK